MLCWPATAGDPILDPIAKVIITDEADAFAADAMLGGDTVRGCSDRELRGLSLPVRDLPSPCRRARSTSAKRQWPSWR